jgi:voltage-dependent calcium channel L type alpha-1D
MCSILKWAIDSTEKDSGPEWDNRPAVALFFVAFIVVVAFFMVNIFVGFVVITFQKEESLASAHLDKNQKACVEFALRARPHKLHCPTNPKQYALWQFVNSNGFEYSILFLISLNTILMGIKYHGQSQTYSSVLEYINMLFTVVYTFECILKLFAWSPKYYFYEIWNVFDFIIVIGSLLDVTLHLSMGQNKYHGIDVKFLRMFRAFRLVKVLHRQHGIRTLLWTFFKSFQVFISYFNSNQIDICDCNGFLLT